jgi:hypothetical protein
MLYSSRVEGSIMPGVLKSNVSTYEFSLEQMKQLISVDLGCSPTSLDVEFVIEEVGGDPMDRYPGTKTVTKVRVTQTHDRSNRGHSSD